MAGSGTAFFSQQKEKFQQQIAAASTAQTKLNIAEQALGILSKPTINAEEAETLAAYAIQLSQE